MSFSAPNKSTSRFTLAVCCDGDISPRCGMGSPLYPQGVTSLDQRGSRIVVRNRDDSRDEEFANSLTICSTRVTRLCENGTLRENWSAAAGRSRYLIGRDLTKRARAL